jgi:hypothetical protein
VLFASGSVLSTNATIFRVQVASWNRIASLSKSLDLPSHAIRTNFLRTAVGTTAAIGQLGSGFISDNNLFFPSSNGILRVVRMFGMR